MKTVQIGPTLWHPKGMANYLLREGVSEEVAGSLVRWVFDGLHPGSFVEAVLEGRLYRAMRAGPVEDICPLASFIETKLCAAVQQMDSWQEVRKRLVMTAHPALRAVKD